jgi:hypothetical protein
VKSPKKIWIALSLILLFFILTNPGISAFKAYKGSNTYYGLKRKFNFFICSVYQSGNKQYFAILGNFFELEQPKPNFSPIDKDRISDSTRAANGDTIKQDPFTEFGGHVDTTTWKPPQKDKQVK